MSEPPKTPSRPLAVLKLPEEEVPRFIVYARSVLDRMTGNAFFPSPRPPLASVAAAVDALSEAEAATRSRTVGTVATRDEKRLAVVVLLQQLRDHVQETADGDPERAAVIIESAGMFVKKARVLAPRVFAAQNGPVSGSVKLVAPQAANRAGYEWAYSTDGSRTWVSLPFTTQANATVSGLTPGSTAQFRYRAVTKDGVGDWSEVVSLIVGAGT